MSPTLNTDIDPETAAEAMNSDEQTDPQTDPAESDDVELGPEAPESERSIFDRLLSTEPSPSLDSDELGDPWQPEQGGFSRIYRGVMKMGDIEGLPAILDIGIGIAEEAAKRSDSDPVEEEADQQGFEAVGE